MVHAMMRIMAQIAMVRSPRMHILMQIAARGLCRVIVAVRQIAANGHPVMPDRAIVGVNVMPILPNRLMMRAPLRRCWHGRHTSRQTDKAQGRHARQDSTFHRLCSSRMRCHESIIGPPRHPLAQTYVYAVTTISPL